MPKKAKYDSYDTTLWSDRFFRWAYKARLWPQLFGFLVTAGGAYALFLLSWGTGVAPLALLAIVCLYLALGFGLLVLRNIWRVIAKPVGIIWLVASSIVVGTLRYRRTRPALS